MTFDEFKSKYKGCSSDEIISALEKMYKNDSDALDEISRAKQNIEYIKSQEKYQGQTPEQCAISLAASLIYWN